MSDIKIPLNPAAIATDPELYRKAGLAAAATLAEKKARHDKLSTEYGTIPHSGAMLLLEFKQRPNIGSFEVVSMNVVRDNQALLPNRLVELCADTSADYQQRWIGVLRHRREGTLHYIMLGRDEAWHVLYDSGGVTELLRLKARKARKRGAMHRELAAIGKEMHIWAPLFMVVITVGSLVLAESGLPTAAWALFVSGFALVVALVVLGNIALARDQKDRRYHCDTRTVDELGWPV